MARSGENHKGGRPLRPSKLLRVPLEHFDSVKQYRDLLDKKDKKK